MGFFSFFPVFHVKFIVNNRANSADRLLKGRIMPTIAVSAPSKGKGTQYIENDLSLMGGPLPLDNTVLITNSNNCNNRSQ